MISANNWRKSLLLAKLLKVKHSERENKLLQSFKSCDVYLNIKFFTGFNNNNLEVDSEVFKIMFGFFVCLFFNSERRKDIVYGNFFPTQQKWLKSYRKQYDNRLVYIC